VTGSSTVSTAHPDQRVELVGAERLLSPVLVRLAEQCVSGSLQSRRDLGASVGRAAGVEVPGPVGVGVGPHHPLPANALVSGIGVGIGGRLRASAFISQSSQRGSFGRRQEA
jgi:hypothetical protein